MVLRGSSLVANMASYEFSYGLVVSGGVHILHRSIMLMGAFLGIQRRYLLSVISWKVIGQGWVCKR